ncbi:uncharacterized protein LOC111103127 isoform X3 [Crassostrea virginica]
MKEKRCHHCQQKAAKIRFMFDEALKLRRFFILRIMCHTCYDRGFSLHALIRRTKPIFLGFYDKPGLLRTYPISDSHGANLKL